MHATTSAERITLHYRDGRSDKIYQANIDPVGKGFVVNFAFGRRGSTLSTGSKTAQPVEYREAKRIYDNLVKQKLTKGYTPGENGKPYQHTRNEQRTTGVLPQLLNPIDESELDQYILDDRWWFQEKFDGRRLLIRKDRQQVTGINRSGLAVALPEPIVHAVEDLDAQFCLLDGECVGDVYHGFDLLERSGLDLRSSPYAVRFAELMNVADASSSDAIRYAKTATHIGQKRRMLEQLRREKKEGVVLKDHQAPYTPGRPASNGTQLKVKFYATASCIVARTNGNRRSVAMELIDGDRRVGVGSVTIPPCHEVPTAGQVIEVRYLYAFAGGSLYQPVFLSVREDLAAGDCCIEQLKHKSLAETDGA